MLKDVVENRLNRIDQIVEGDGAENNLAIDGDQGVTLFCRQHGGEDRGDMLAEHLKEASLSSSVNESGASKETATITMSVLPGAPSEESSGMMTGAARTDERR
ncbi:MAG: hypothetical protein MRJ92_07820 [Nitrospira sp.]|nr:hypothetical protein [Nitrospira sp.]